MPQSDKFTKLVFLKQFQKNLGNKYSEKEIADIYDAFVKTLIDAILAGKRVIMLGLGTFVLKIHKGHAIRYSKSQNEIGDYLVLRFTASTKITEQLKADSQKLIRKLTAQSRRKQRETAEKGTTNEKT